MVPIFHVTFLSETIEYFILALLSHGFSIVRIVGNMNEFITARISYQIVMPPSRPIRMPKTKVIGPTVQAAECAIHKLTNGTVGNIYGSVYIWYTFLLNLLHKGSLTLGSFLTPEHCCGNFHQNFNTEWHHCTGHYIFYV